MKRKFSEIEGSDYADLTEVTKAFVIEQISLCRQRGHKEKYAKKIVTHNVMVLLAELEMLGILVEIPEPLLRIRRHPGRSWNANKTVRQLRELFDPEQGHRFSALGVWGRVNLELVRSALIIPLKPHDRVLCFAVALVVPQYWNFRNFLGRQKRKILPKLSLKVLK